MRAQVNRLIRTSVFRITLLYLVLFLVSSGILLAFVGLVTFGALDRQIGATIANDARSLVGIYERRGLGRLQRIIDARSARDRFNLYLLVTPAGQVLAGNLTAWPDPDQDFVRQRRDNWIDFLYSREGPDGAEDRLAYAQMITLPPGLRLLVGRDVNDRRIIQRKLTNTVLISVILIFGLGLAGGVILARRSARQVEAINETLTGIMAGDLSRRIAVGRGQDELTKLAVALNSMLDRIEALMMGLREVSENIAHDLRSPLNRIRSDLDLSLMRARDPNADQAVLERTVAEVTQLVQVFEALLAIARAESGGDGLQKTDVDLEDVVDDAVDLYEALAEEREVSLVSDLEESQIVHGHRGSLMQAVSNLLDNALKFSPSGGKITVRLARVEEAGIELRITDEGPGIPKADRQNVLGRFVRLDEARNTPGSGLGLSLVKAVADMHKASLDLRSGPDGRGLSVSIVFQR